MKATGINATIETERVIVEAAGKRGWLVMYPDGTVVAYKTMDEVLEAAKERARKMIASGSIRLTTVEWR